MNQLIVHGHFYQPPRENPWTGKIDDELSAAPYPNWNARILVECYAANRAVTVSPGSEAPGLSGAERDGHTVVDNYRSLSFDFGPTLLDWLRKAAPDLIDGLREADAASRQRLGHGNVIAHGYNHAILPLLSLRNKRTQVRWGLAHFRHTFGRDPEGFWLPEAGADDETLNLLAEAGVRFTILSPGQLFAVRPAPATPWRKDIKGSDLDQPYRYWTRGNREIAVCFYDGSVANDMAFGRLLDDGRQLGERLLAELKARRTDGARFFAVATDGESFGHHHRKGAETLAAAFRQLEAQGIRITNFAAFLAEHPPRAEALLHEPGSWSCGHGVERWRDHCGDTAGGEPGWTQSWRRPLFDAIHTLDEELALVFERSDLFKHPWAARDAYIDVLLSPETRPAFLSAHVHASADPAQIASLLEMQRFSMSMFASCGWFFDDPARLETRQVLRYAARALELCPESESPRIKALFLERLKTLRSNKYPKLDGASLFEDVETSSRSGIPSRIAYEDVKEDSPR
jgi:alpha-amylase/alpha-mannosidase (GH57 family)